MGNRAVVFFGTEKGSVGTYLHWLGGPEYVLAFLRVLTERGWDRRDYAHARFTAVVVEYLDLVGDGGLSVGSVAYTGYFSAHDPGDNGIYFVELREGEWIVSQWKDGEEIDRSPSRDTRLDEPQRKVFAATVLQLRKSREARAKAREE